MSLISLIYSEALISIVCGVSLSSLASLKMSINRATHPLLFSIFLGLFH